VSILYGWTPLVAIFLIVIPSEGRGEHEASAESRERRARRSDAVAEPEMTPESRDIASAEQKRGKAA
jgi:membrane protein required for beta-lactamase induction